MRVRHHLAQSSHGPRPHRRPVRTHGRLWSSRGMPLGLQPHVAATRASPGPVAFSPGNRKIRLALERYQITRAQPQQRSNVLSPSVSSLILCPLYTFDDQRPWNHPANMPSSWGRLRVSHPPRLLSLLNDPASAVYGTAQMTDAFTSVQKLVWLLLPRLRNSLYASLSCLVTLKAHPKYWSKLGKW